MQRVQVMAEQAAQLVAAQMAAQSAADASRSLQGEDFERQVAAAVAAREEEAARQVAAAQADVETAR